MLAFSQNISKNKIARDRFSFHYSRDIRFNSRIIREFNNSRTIREIYD